MRRRRWGSSSQQTHTNCRDGGPVDSCGSEGEVVGSGVAKGDPMFQVCIKCVSNVCQMCVKCASMCVKCASDVCQMCIRYVSNVHQCVLNMSSVYQSVHYI